MNKIYVKVNSTFDLMGFMQPKSITWKDGRVFPIDEVRDFQPSGYASCFTVRIKGETKHLFFEKCPERFAAHFGRWFVKGS